MGLFTSRRKEGIERCDSAPFCRAIITGEREKHDQEAQSQLDRSSIQSPVWDTEFDAAEEAVGGVTGGPERRAVGGWRMTNSCPELNHFSWGVTGAVTKGLTFVSLGMANFA